MKEIQDLQLSIQEDNGEHLVNADEREKYLKALAAGRQKLTRKEVMAAQRRIQDKTIEFVKTLKSLPPALI